MCADASIQGDRRLVYVRPLQRILVKQSTSQLDLSPLTREGTQGLERRTRPLSRQSRRRTSSSGSQGQEWQPHTHPVSGIRYHPLISKPSNAGASAHVTTRRKYKWQLQLPDGNAPPTPPSNVGYSADLFMRLAQRGHERQQQFLDGNTPQKSPDVGSSADSIAQEEHERQEGFPGGGIPPSVSRRAGRRRC